MGNNYMKIYFAASIRGGRNDVAIYEQLIKHLKQYGEVLTEHVGDPGYVSPAKEHDEILHHENLEKLLSSDVIVAEVSTPSLGVGYELGRAAADKKRVLCLYCPDATKILSGMIAGCPDLPVTEYKTVDEAKKIIDDFFTNH
jgi:hypothetical protein